MNRIDTQPKASTSLRGITEAARLAGLILGLTICIANLAAGQLGVPENITPSHITTSWCRHEAVACPDSEPPSSRDRALLNYDLAVLYVVPTNIAYDSLVHQRLVDATHDIVAWYQVATGGITWKLADPEVVRVYYALQTWEYYRDNGNWWGSLPGEMDSQGQPIWEPGTVTAVWAHGAGWWAGGAQGCGTDCGLVLLGVEIFPEFNDPAYSGGSCPAGVGGVAWPCTPEGAYAHELGHTLGLGHPIDNPATSAVAYHSLMQTHWNYPTYAPPEESPWGLLTLERQVLLSSSFLQENIDLEQIHVGADIVNLPLAGAAPMVDFSYDIRGDTVNFTNLSIGGTLFYWTFGDGAVSNESDPSHVYSASSDCTVHLRASTNSAMMAIDSQTVDVYDCPVLVTGDENGDGVISSADVIYEVNYIFKSGPAPQPCEAASDVNCDGSVSSGDIIYKVNHVFKGGPAPCDVCALIPSVWTCP